MITRLTHRLASGVPFLAPRPPTRVERFAAMAEQLGIPFDFKKPEFSMTVVHRVVKGLASRMPDGDPRPHDNDLEDEGETERTVGESYDGSSGREDEGDGDE